MHFCIMIIQHLSIFVSLLNFINSKETVAKVARKLNLDFRSFRTSFSQSRSSTENALVKCLGTCTQLLETKARLPE